MLRHIRAGVYRFLHDDPAKKSPLTKSERAFLNSDDKNQTSSRPLKKYGISNAAVSGASEP